MVSCRERLHGDEAWREVPVIIVTAKDLTREDVDRLNGHVVSAAKGRLPATGPGPRHSAGDCAAGRPQLTPSWVRGAQCRGCSRRGQRDEPRHTTPLAASWLRGPNRGGWRAGCNSGCGREARSHLDGHEPAGSGRLGSHAADQGSARYPAHSDHWPDRRTRWRPIGTSVSKRVATTTTPSRSSSDGFLEKIERLPGTGAA